MTSFVGREDKDGVIVDEEVDVNASDLFKINLEHKKTVSLRWIVQGYSMCEEALVEIP
jgi:hypothetical protein